MGGHSSCLRARKSTLARNQALLDLDLGLPASSTMRNRVLLFKNSMAFCHGSPSQQRANLFPSGFLSCEPGTQPLCCLNIWVRVWYEVPFEVSM